MRKQSSQYSHAYRDEEDAPPCGKFNPAWYKTNVLLHRPNLGASAATTRKLPSDKNLQHEYGWRQERDGSGSKDVLGGWAEHEGTGHLQAPRDFKALNKLAMVSGCKNNKDMTAFRSTNDARVKVTSLSVDMKKPYDDFTTFGASTSANENMSDLYSHSFRFDWVNTKPSAAEIVAASKAKGPGQTKTSMLAEKAAREKLAVKEVEKPWVMSAFKNVPAKVGQTG